MSASYSYSDSWHLTISPSQATLLYSWLSALEGGTVTTNLCVFLDAPGVEPTTLITVPALAFLLRPTSRPNAPFLFDLGVHKDWATLAPDLAAQVEQVYLNVATALAAAGASFADVAKLTAYLVDWTPEKFEPFMAGRARASAKLGGAVLPPFTGIGVATLAEPDMLVELEATAVVD